MRLRMLYHVSQTEMMILDLPCIFSGKFLNELLTSFFTLKSARFKEICILQSF